MQSLHCIIPISHIRFMTFLWSQYIFYLLPPFAQFAKIARFWRIECKPTSLPPETHYNNCRLVCLSFSSFFNKLAYTCLICFHIFSPDMHIILRMIIRDYPSYRLLYHNRNVSALTYSPNIQRIFGVFAISIFPSVCRIHKMARLPRHWKSYSLVLLCKLQ